MALSDWDPVMLTIYLNEVYSKPPETRPVSKLRRRYVLDPIVIDLRHGPDEEHGRSEGSHRQDGHPETVDIYAVNH